MCWNRKCEAEWRASANWSSPRPVSPTARSSAIGFRPYAVQISSDLTQHRYRAVLRHTFFLGVLLRVELELPSGLTIRARMTKEEYAHQGLRGRQRGLLPNPPIPRAGRGNRRIAAGTRARVPGTACVRGEYLRFDSCTAKLVW